MEVPPVIGSPEAIAPWPDSRPRWRWLVWLALLGPYPLILGVAPAALEALNRGRGGGRLTAALPGSVPELLWVAGENLATFGVLFLAGWLVVKPGLDDLRLRWTVSWGGGERPGSWRIWVLGVLHSVTIRIPVTLALMAVMAATYWLKDGDAAALNSMRPRIESVVEPGALADPVYFLLTISLLSFVVAGLREELWRTCVISGLVGLQGGGRGWRNGMRANALAALLFGLGHFPQGWTGVLVTTLLGFCLGSVMLVHRSTWVAVLAHGFFDALTFLILRVAQMSGWLEGMHARDF